MKTLLIMRHAKSDWSQPGLSDHDRPLNKRGLRNAPAMGDWLISQGIQPELAISSTAARAKSTTGFVLAQFDHEIPMHFDSGLYLASPESWRTIIPVYADSEETILIIGHNPGLERLVYELTGAYESIPTATIACVELDCENWSDLTGQLSGQLQNIWRPKEIGVE